jgi:O-antigen/teichoic acid export membrane protein
MSSIKQQALSGIKWNSVAKITTDLLSVVQLMIVARYIDKADFGTMSIIHVVLGMVGMFTDLGMYAAMMHKQDITNDQYNSIYWFNWILNASIFVLVCIAAHPIALFYNDVNLTHLICLAALGILLAPFGKIFHTIKQKNLEFSFISKVGIIGNLLVFLTTVLFCLLGWGIYALIFPVLIRGVFTAIVFSIAGRKQFKVQFHFNMSEIKDFFKIGIYDTGAQLMDYISYKIDIILVGRLFGLEVLGLYNMGKELALKTMKMINPIINSVATPILAKLQNEPDKIKLNYSRILSFVGFINIPILIALSIFSEEVVNIFFSEKYANAATFVRILAFWGIFASIGNPAGNLVVAKGRTDLSFKWTIIRCSLAPLFVYVASFFHVEAIAYSQVILRFVFFLIYWYMMIRPLAGLSLYEYVSSFSNSVLCSIIASVPTLIFAINVTLESQLAYLIIGCAIFAVTYLIFSYVTNKKIVKFIISLVKK